MSGFRQLKTRWKGLILQDRWEDVLQEALTLPGREAIGPLISFFPQTPEIKWRGVAIFGKVLAQLADRDLESARVVMRQLMWQLNEESGNLGWGIPEAFGSALACTALYLREAPPIPDASAPKSADQRPAPRLAGEYSRILHSYIRNTGREDNFCEHGPMRRGAFWAVARFAAAYPGLAADMFESMLTGLADEEAGCRGMAAWGLKIFNANIPLNREQKQSAREALQRLADSTDPAEQTSLDLLAEGAGETGWSRIREATVRDLAQESLAAFDD